MAGAGAALLGACCPTPKPPIDYVNQRVVTIDGKKVHVRRRLSSWTAQDYDSYSTAIQVMKARPVTDPTSWLFQANIHGVPGGPAGNPAWAKCPHGTEHFLSWHRMYLYWWERIVRKASGDPDFSIGYWRYEGADPASLAIPQPFREPATGNPLFETRSAAINSGASLPASVVDASNALDETTLLAPPSPGFSSGIESSPHNNVHVQVSGLMGSVATAARDPIFWTHHANIDRYWKRWHDDASHTVPSGTFLTTAFQFFDENGAGVSMTGADILDTLGQLGYKYDDDPRPSEARSGRRVATTMPSQPPTILASGPAPRFELEGNAKGYDVALPAETTTKMRSVFVARQQRVILTLTDIAANGPPDVSYEVYLNLPQGAAPDYKSPHFVGTFSAFGADTQHAGHAGHAPIRVSLNITHTLAALDSGGSLDPANLRITFVPVRTGVPTGSTVQTRVITSFGKLELTTE